MFCLYVRPVASGDFVGRPVLVGNGAAHDVVACGGGLVTFLGVGAGVAVVAMSNAVAMGPAVAIRIRSPPLVEIIAASPPAAAAPGLGRKLVTEGLDLAGEVGVGGGKRGVRSDELLQDGLLVGGSTGKVVKRSVVDGVEETGVEGGGVG
jgi:hypothetical protein